MNDLSESLCCQDELKKLNKDIQFKVDDAVRQCLELSKELEEKSQHF